MFFLCQKICIPLLCSSCVPAFIIISIGLLYHALGMTYNVNISKEVDNGRLGQIIGCVMLENHCEKSTRCQKMHLKLKVSSLPLI